MFVLRDLASLRSRQWMQQEERMVVRAVLIGRALERRDLEEAAILRMDVDYPLEIGGGDER